MRWQNAMSLQSCTRRAGRSWKFSRTLTPARTVVARAITSRSNSLPCEREHDFNAVAGSIPRDRRCSEMTDEQAPRVCIVGAGTRFLSGISYYTLRLARALADR